MDVTDKMVKQVLREETSLLVSALDRLLIAGTVPYTNGLGS